jgi:hypothetical protein
MSGAGRRPGAWEAAMTTTELTGLAGELQGLDATGPAELARRGEVTRSSWSRRRSSASRR